MSISELLLRVKRANRAIHGGCKVGSARAAKPPQPLQFFNRPIIREEVDFFVFESPLALALPNMWLEGEECHISQLLKVIALDEPPIARLVFDAVPNVALEIEVLEACAGDLSVCASEKLVKCHVWPHKRTQKCVERRLGRQAVDKLPRTGRVRETAVLDAEAAGAVAPNIAPCRTQINRHQVEFAHLLIAWHVVAP